MKSKAEELGEAFGYLQTDEILLLKSVAKKLRKNAVVVNIGAGIGTTAMAVLEERPDLAKSFYSIDLQGGTDPFGGLGNEENAFRIAGLLDILPVQIQGDSKVVGLEWEGEKVDFLIVDGDHSYAGCHSDIKSWEPHLAEGAFIAFHDYVSRYFTAVISVTNDIINNDNRYKKIDLAKTMLLLKYTKDPRS